MFRKPVLAAFLASVALAALPGAVSAAVTNTQITSGPSGTVSAGSVTFTFSSPEDGGFECSLDGAEWSACSAPQSYDGLADGDHRFEVRALNRPLNPDPTPASSEFTVVTYVPDPPETTIVSAPSGTIPTGTAAFEFAAPGASSFQCRLDDDWGACGSPRVYHGLSEGSHGFEVRGIDAVGNVDLSPAEVGFRVDFGPPKPVAGQSFNLEPAKGSVQLQCPGEDEYAPLTSFKQVPMGCLVNTRQGVVSLTASKGSSGELQNANFWGGVFVVSQKEGDDQTVELKLAGKRMCERRESASQPAARASRQATAYASRSRRGGRRAWGSGKGNYETSGSYGSATVRGTTWLVADRCDASTLFKVADGTVSVQDFVKDKQVVLEAGEQYLAKAPIPRLNPKLFP